MQAVSVPLHSTTNIGVGVTDASIVYTSGCQLPYRDTGVSETHVECVAKFKKTITFVYSYMLQLQMTLMTVRYKY